MITRRDFLKLSGVSTLALYAAARGNPLMRALAASAKIGLSDPAMQPKFAYPVPDALAPSFKYVPDKSNKNKASFTVGVGPSVQDAGLVDSLGLPLSTPIWGYGQNGVYTWPGKTFEVKSGDKTEVRWMNDLTGITEHLLPVDTSLHWAYSLPGFELNSIATDGVPIVAHLHGGHTNFQFDGNPEYFFSPGFGVVGPRWMDQKYNYKNDQPAGNLWYHDHALGITRLNVYAGLAGFYFVRDDVDTGLADNPLGLPAWPYEKAYAIQDRMFYDTGELFYPAFPDDPYYDDFIYGEVGDEGLPDEFFPGGGPSALAEFFGDHMVVNGLIWPKEIVEPRNYRLHLLNGTDSRFMAIQFVAVPANETNFDNAGTPIPFYVVGSDQGLASAATLTDTLLSEPGSRYDIVFDFKGLQGKRVIMKNIGGDEPFGGDIPGPVTYDDTDKVMAFDVQVAPDGVDAYDPVNITGAYVPSTTASTRIRKVALFEGMDEFGRLQPLLGTAEPATDFAGNPINWPADPKYSSVGLIGPMEGSIAWHSPTTENPALGSTEEWEVWNVTGDAHPVHLHLVHFDVLDRQEINFDSNADEDGFIPDGSTPADDGVYRVSQPVVQHNGLVGNGFKIVHPSNPSDGYGPIVSQPDGYVENTPKDMVTALPGQITRIKATFDKPGRYVWHCHILSHEDHEMMRVLHVGPGA